MLHLGHVTKHDVSSLVQVVDDLTQVSSELLAYMLWSVRSNNEPEVFLCELLEVGQGRGRDVSLPLQVSFSCLDHVAELLVVIHEVHKRLSFVR